MAVLLFVIFIVVPIVELAIIIQVGQLIGPLWTVLLLLLSAVIGSFLLRREGRRAWRSFRRAMDAGRVPTREAADGAMVIMGGALMLTPGFLTDALGVLCLLPPSRAVLRRMATAAITRRLLADDSTRPVRTRRARGRRAQRSGYPPPAQRRNRPPRIIEGDSER